jgi:hypothetical protein
MFGLDLVVALIGTAVLESAVAKVVVTKSLSTIVVREWILSFACAAFAGFFMQRTWRGRMAKWVWILPACFFILTFSRSAFASSQLSIGEAGNSLMKSLFARFSGMDCALHSSACRDFLVATVPLVRGTSYSLAAYVFERVCGPRLRERND